jgi:hypothetical protein
MKAFTAVTVALAAALLSAARLCLLAVLLSNVGALAADVSFAQTSSNPTSTQCQLTGLAVAPFGYAATKRHGLEAYGSEAI